MVLGERVANDAGTRVSNSVNPVYPIDEPEQPMKRVGCIFGPQRVRAYEKLVIPNENAFDVKDCDRLLSAYSPQRRYGLQWSDPLWGIFLVACKACELISVRGFKVIFELILCESASLSPRAAAFRSQVLSGEMCFLRIRAYPENCGKMAARSRDLTAKICPILFTCMRTRYRTH